MKYFITCLMVLLLSNNCLLAQNSKTSSFSVEWMKSYSTEEDFGQEKGIFKQLFSFIAGDNETELSNPFGIIAIDTNKYFVLDQGLKRPLICSDDGINFVENDSIKSYPSLVDAVVFKNHKILFTDSHLKKVFLYNIEKDLISEFYLDKTPEQPTGIYYSKFNDFIYISDTKNHKIDKYDSEGNLVESYGNRGNEKGEFNYPTYITGDEKGNIFIVDALNFRVQIFDKEFNFINMFGVAGDASGYFNRPKGIAVDSFGHLYIVDALFHVIQIFNTKGQFLFSFGGQGRLKSQLWLPAGIFIDDRNNIFVADVYNSRIQKYRFVHGKN